MLGLLFPSRCMVCDAAGASPCARCVDRLHSAGRVPAPPGLDSCSALLVYEGVTRQLVAGLKFRNRRSGLARLGAALAALAALSRVEVDEVVWAPTSVARRRARGYDQAELLARATARAAGLPCRRCLARASSAPQTGQSLIARLSGPEFTCISGVRARVLVVDDVLTTGATLSAAGRALRARGAHEVHGLVLARTPAPNEPM